MVIGVVGLAIPFLSFGLSHDRGVVLGEMPLKVASGSASADLSHRISDRMVIADRHIDMPLLAWRDGQAALFTGAWLWPDGARPGHTGNTVIFGHRFRYLPPLSNTLFNLDKAVVGDTVSIHWNGIDYHYQIIGSRVIEPTDLSVLAPSSDERVTIITCTPIWSTSHRLVVTAVRI